MNLPVGLLGSTPTSINGALAAIPS